MSFNQKKRRMNFEAMEKRELFTADLGMDLAIPDVEPEQMGQDRQYFVADSFSFGVEREMKESGEKGGTEDINIGVGELQECTISKSMDMASAKLAQFAINGNSPGQAEIDFVEVAGDEPASDGVVDAADYTVWRDNMGSEVDPETVDEVFAESNESESYLQYRLKDVLVTSYS